MLKLNKKDDDDEVGSVIEVDTVHLMLLWKEQL